MMIIYINIYICVYLYTELFLLSVIRPFYVAIPRYSVKKSAALPLM